ncbi:MAG: PQQ-dependent sugar dehydrogenase [Ignavibacteriaceae bacterium]|nr:PQQ-dependent sugar dehydrogenase [Ignavibacteriaceae bacterium]
MQKMILTLAMLCLSCSDKNFSQITIHNAFPNLTFSNPLDLQNSADGTNRIFVVEQTGIIYVFENYSDVSVKKIFLDISDSVSSGGEMGLLGLAFHPNYENNGYFFVNYTKSQPYRRTLIVRFQVSSTNSDSADRHSSKILMEIPQPYSNHNGGQLSFGPDGYLYIALGDGGSGGDPQNNAQNKSSLLGKLLRIDVDQAQGNKNYSIPIDNPFVNNNQGYKEEIFAFGLRNPWRFSFDIPSNRLWCADVGQDAWEEIDLIVKGGNYGWRCYEGSHDYDLDGCTSTEYIPPVWEYSHQEGSSITGGFVYRGSNIPELFGKYIYADFISRKIWALTYDGVNPAVNQLLLTANGSISSFGVDENNELYICSFNGRIYKLKSNSSIDAPSNLRVVSNSPTSIELEWNDNSDNETGFKIERQVGTNAFELVDSVAANVTSFLDNSISNAFSYGYRVSAFNSTSSSSYSNVASFVTKTDDKLNSLPENFQLNQNYPNPFNPTTNIEYAINRRQTITLKIYDSLGHDIETLVSGEKDAGYYSVDFQASNLSSGVYFYQIKGGSFIETRKMILMK